MSGEAKLSLTITKSVAGTGKTVRPAFCDCSVMPVLKLTELVSQVMQPFTSVTQSVYVPEQSACAVEVF